MAVLTAMIQGETLPCTESRIWLSDTLVVRRNGNEHNHWLTIASGGNTIKIYGSAAAIETLCVNIGLAQTLYQEEIATQRSLNPQEG